MKINEAAKYGYVKTIDEDHEIAIATNGKQVELRIKGLARDFQNKPFEELK